MPHALIAGAGIGGLTAALALARGGWEVSLLERAPALETIGAGLQISPNAAHVLRRLEVLDDVIARAVQPHVVRVRAARSGRTLSALPIGEATRRWGAPYLVIHRADLQAVLVGAVAASPRIDLHLGTCLAGFGATAQGVVASARQGLMTRSFAADALIGADGIQSTVRARLAEGADDRPQETGRMAWRAMVPRTAIDATPDAPETTLWLGRDAHLVHYPLAGDALNVVAVIRDGPSDPAALWASPGARDVITRRFASWHGDARDLIAAAPAWTRWPLYDRAPLAAWNAGPVALLGDAAHPVLPFLAQGAAQAIEDAAALASALAATRDVPLALAAYSQARIARATRVQALSREQGRLYHLSGPAALARDAAMRLAGPRRLLARYDWLYGAVPGA